MGIKGMLCRLVEEVGALCAAALQLPIFEGTCLIESPPAIDDVVAHDLEGASVDSVMTVEDGTGSDDTVVEEGRLRGDASCGSLGGWSGKFSLALSPLKFLAAASYAKAASSAVSNVPSHTLAAFFGSRISAAHFPQGRCLTPRYLRFFTGCASG